MRKKLILRLKNRITPALLLLPVLVGIVLTGPINTVRADCLDGLDPIAYWRLDEAASPFADNFGSNDAVCGDADSVCPTQTLNELVTNSQLFDEASVTGLKVADASDDFDWAYDASFSIAAWMKASTNTSTDVIVGRVDTAGGADLRWFLAIAPTGEATALIKASNGDGSGSLLLGSTVITNNQWHYLVLVRDNTAGQNLLYVDGLLEASADVTYSDTTSFASTKPVNIGWLDIETRFRFNGLLDEVAIYNQALPIDIIAQQYLNAQDGLGYCDNIPPEITSTAGSTATENVQYTYTPTVANGDGDILTWSIENEPTGMTIDTNTGEVNWTPAQGVPSPVSFTITVDDGHGGTDTEAISITVSAGTTPTNNPPAITSKAVTKATEGVQYKYTAKANDPDGDTLLWSLSGAPKGMAVSNSGVVTWTPPAGSSSSSPVTYTLAVSDGNGGKDSQKVSLTIAAAGTTSTSSGGGGGGGGCFIETTLAGGQGGGSIVVWMLSVLGSMLAVTVKR